MTVDASTRQFYDERAAEYAEYSVERAGHAKLRAFLEAMPEGGRVLDFGAGVGWAAAAMRDAGLRADAMDASAGLAEEARLRFGITVRVAEFAVLSARQRYDGIWSHFALQHAPREGRPAIFERLRAALRPGGLLYFAVQKGPLDWRDDLGRLYCPFSERDAEALLGEAGFVGARFEYGTGKSYDGKPTLNLYAWAEAGG